jgi:hypothetical protein
MSKQIKVTLNGRRQIAYTIDVWIDEETWWGDEKALMEGYADHPAQLAEEILEAEDIGSSTHQGVSKYQITQSTAEDMWGNQFLGCTADVNKLTKEDKNE